MRLSQLALILHAEGRNLINESPGYKTYNGYDASFYCSCDRRCFLPPSCCMARLHEARPRSEDQDAHAEFAARLKFVAKHSGGYSELARRAGIGRSTLFYYIREGDPTRIVLKKISDATGIDFKWLGTGVGAPFVDSVRDSVTVPIIAVQDGDPSAPIPFLTKRIFGQLSREVIAGSFEVSSQVAIVGFRIADHYMEGTFWPGDWVLVDTGNKGQGDGVYCLQTNGGLLVRHVVYANENEAIIRNEAEFRARRGGITLKQRGPKTAMGIIGRVIISERRLM